MSEKPDLPPDVVKALQAGRKIQAIKMLRARRGLDLAQAKEQVELYLDEHPNAPTRRQHREMNLIPLLLAAAIAIVAYLAFEYI